MNILLFLFWVGMSGVDLFYLKTEPIIWMLGFLIAEMFGVLCVTQRNGKPQHKLLNKLLHQGNTLMPQVNSRRANAAARGF